MKRISIFLVLVLILNILFTGCGSKNLETSKDTEKQSQTNQEKTKTQNIETLKFSAICPHFGMNPTETIVHKEWLKEMEQYLGRKLDIDFQYIPWAEYNEKMKLTLASGDFADIMCVTNQEDVINYGEEGLFVNIAKYDDIIPNYKKWINEAKDGKLKAYTKNGDAFGFCGDSYSSKSEAGITLEYATIFRDDIFKKHNLKVPETLEELYEIGKQLKHLYPESYPINISEPYIGLEMFYNANHTSKNIYWNGKKYVYGPVEDSYKEALIYLNKLYKEELLDPEYYIDTFEQAKKKALTGKTFIWPRAWYSFANDHLNSNEQSQGHWSLTLHPQNKKYGSTWHIGKINGYKSLGAQSIVISQKTKYPEELIKLLDYQFNDKVVTLLTWGIKGVTYNVNEDGTKDLIPEIKNAENPWVKGNEYGIRASANVRSGIQFAPSDSKAFINFAPNDPVYINKKYFNKPWELCFNYEGVDENLLKPQEPVILLNKEENELNSTIMTPIKSYVDEMEIKFVTGQESFDNWDKYTQQIENMGDYQSILDLRNKKAAEYYSRIK